MHDYAEQQFKKSDSVEAWASTCDYAAKLSGGDPDIFMRDVSRVFTGFTQKLAPLDYLLQPITGDDKPYKVRFKSDGFNGAFADPDPQNNQVRHIWFYTQLAYSWGEDLAVMANFFHEFFPGQGGQSLNDYIAGLAGAGLGTQLREGTISPYDVGNHIRNLFGDQ